MAAPFQLPLIPPELTQEAEAMLRQQLKKEVLSLSFRAYQECVKHLLTAMGYRDVKAMGRIHKRGRTPHGGADMTASSNTGVTQSQIILQIKQYQRPVSRRFVDELRGACLRVGAHQGLLITTSIFSRAARKASARDRLAPVQLLDGELLLDLLIVHEVGVHRMNKIPQVDEAFFTALRDQYPPVEQKHPAGVNTRLSKKHKPIYTPQGHQLLFGRKEDEMMWRTHALFGISSLWLLEPLLQPANSSNIGILAVVAAFGALLPDLDAAESKVKSLNISGIRPFAPLSYIVYHVWGHRGPLHSLLGLMGIGLGCIASSTWIGPQPSLALILGYGSHLAADACTKTGIPLFYPSKRRYFLLPPRLRFTTGSQAEEMLLPVLAAVVLLLILSYFPQS